MTDSALRVLHVIAHMEKGGAERQMCLLADASRHAHVIAVLSGNERPSDHTVELLPDLAFFPTIKRIRRMIRAHQIDVLHTWVPERLTVPATLAARLEGIPILSGDRRKPRSYGYFFFRDRLYYVPYLLADVIVPNYPIHPKPFSLAKLLGFRRKTEVIPNGIVRKGAPGALKGVPNRILFVGRLVEQKRVALLIRAMPDLVNTGIKGLDIVGDGPDRGMLGELAQEMGLTDAVTFHGAQFNWPSLFEPSTHMVALPSASEGMSNTVFEAIDHGFLPLVSDSPEMRSLFKDFRSGPEFFDLGDIDDLKRAVLAVGAMPQAALQTRLDTLREGLEQYSVEDMAARYDALYERLAQRN